MSEYATTPTWPAGTKGWRVSGVYRRSPLADTYYAAELDWVPMTRPEEYLQGALMEIAIDAPVLVSMSQRYRILAELLRGLREQVSPIGCALARVYGPDFNVPLPVELLAADVLLLTEPLAALPPVLAAGKTNVVVIDQDLRADGPERGANRLSVALLQPDPAGPTAERFAAWMKASPLLQALSDMRLEPVIGAAA